jgi:hypothetical protein
MKGSVQPVSGPISLQGTPSHADNNRGLDLTRFVFPRERQASHVPGLTGPNRVRLAQIRSDQRPQRFFVDLMS